MRVRDRRPVVLQQALNLLVHVGSSHAQLQQTHARRLFKGIHIHRKTGICLAVER